MLIEWKRILSAEDRQSRSGYVAIAVGSIFFAVGLFARSMILIPD